MEKNTSKNLKKTKPAIELSLYKIFWVFIIASVIGYGVEMIISLSQFGHFESRQGLLYGPFNQVYGFGAVLMVLFLHKLSLKHIFWAFMASALIGGGFEALSSLLQQMAFGAVSWDYASQPLSILGGRTSFILMFYWGILGVLFMKGIYPYLMRLVEWIPKKPGHILAVLLAIFFAFNITVSIAAVHRWSDRIDGVPAKNTIDVFLDNHYPNNLMKTVYPNMTFTKGGGANTSDANINP